MATPEGLFDYLLVVIIFFVGLVIGILLQREPKALSGYRPEGPEIDLHTVTPPQGGTGLCPPPREVIVRMPQLEAAWSQTPPPPPHSDLN